MRDPTNVGARMPCEQRQRRNPNLEISQEDSDPGAALPPDSLTDFVDEAAGGAIEITCKVPDTIVSPHAVLVLPGFLGRRFHYGNFCNEMAAEGIVAATVERSSPDSTVKAMEWITRETGCKTIHLFAHSHGGADGVKLVEYVNGENIKSLTLAGTRSLSHNHSLQMLGRGVRSLGQSGSFIPAIRKSASRDPAKFMKHGVEYGKYLLIGFPGHVVHGLGEVSTLRIDGSLLAAIRQAGKTAVAGMFFPRDSLVPKHEALELERQGLFQIFHMLPDRTRADHSWPVSHPDEASSEYRSGILLNLDPAYAQSSELKRAA